MIMLTVKYPTCPLYQSLLERENPFQCMLVIFTLFAIASDFSNCYNKPSCVCSYLFIVYMSASSLRVFVCSIFNSVCHHIPRNVAPMRNWLLWRDMCCMCALYLSNRYCESCEEKRQSWTILP